MLDILLKFHVPRQTIVNFCVRLYNSYTFILPQSVDCDNKVHTLLKLNDVQTSALFQLGCKNIFEDTRVHVEVTRPL